MLMQKVYKKCFFVALAVGLAVFFLTAAGFAGEDPQKQTGELSKIQKIKAAGKLVVGTSADYPPYEFHLLKDKEMELVGLDIDIANAIAKELGVKLVVRDIVFHKLFEVLISDEVDIVIAGMAPTERRMQAVDFSDVYYQAIQKMLMRGEDAQSSTYIKDLRGKRVGTQKGSIQDDMGRKVIVGADFVTMEKVDELVAALKEKKIDTVLLEKPVAESFVIRNKDLKSIECTLGAFDTLLGSAIAIKKGNKEFLDEINRILLKLKNENKIDEFVEDALALMRE